MRSWEVLAFVARCSTRNLLRRQLQRLRQPKYLFAMLAGLFYFWSVFANAFRTSRHPTELGFATALVTSILLGLGLMVVVLAWVFGENRGLVFTEAEIQFLFPAPLSRAQLIHYKLARNLLLSAFTAFFITLGFGKRVSSHPLLFFVGAWIGTGTLSLHTVAASLTRASLLEHGIRGSVRRFAGLAVPLVLVGSVVVGIWRAPPFPARFFDFSTWLDQLLRSPPLSWAVLPLRVILGTALAPDAAHFARALPAALVVIALHYLWAMSTDADFEQASLLSAERRGRVLEQRRRGQLPLRTTRAPFKLAASGRPAFALYWKNLTAGVRLLSVRLMLVLAVSITTFAVGAVIAADSAGLGATVSITALVVGAYCAFFGVQVYRIDFRMDLPNMDLLRTFPVPGYAVAAAQVLAPLTVLAASEWLCVLVAVAAVPRGLLSPGDRLGLGVALALIFPALTLCTLLVQNAAALLFPGWIAGGLQNSRGIEAMGQRLLTLAGSLVAVAVAVAPAVLVGGALTWLLYGRLGWLATAPAAVLAAGVIAVEALFAVLALGRVFERFDLSQ